MRVVLKTSGILALGFALSGCGAADSPREQAASDTGAETAKPQQVATATPAVNTVPVTTASIGPGKYVASIQGMS
jgi:hypothetical protein